MKWGYQKPIRNTFYALMVMLVSGCVVMGHDAEVGESLRDKDLKKIQLGQTTKQEILEMFGPPLAIARKGKILKLPRAGERKAGSEEIQSEIFFELFSTKYTLNPEHIIYYYFSTEVSGVGGFFLFVGKTSAELNVDKLWILINEKTAVVEDYIFRTQD